MALKWKNMTSNPFKLSRLDLFPQAIVDHLLTFYNYDFLKKKNVQRSFLITYGNGNFILFVALLWKLFLDCGAMVVRAASVFEKG